MSKFADKDKVAAEIYRLRSVADFEKIFGIDEAAEIDGGSKWDRFWNITIPMISPVTFYLSLIGFIGTFKAFNHIYVMRTPSAQNTVVTTSLLVFDRFYKANQYGVATAQAIVLFLVILGLTLAQNKLMEDRVFYG